MAFILGFGFWFLGLLIASFTLIPILIILAFGIPTTRRLERLGVLKKGNGIVKGYMVTMVILPIIFIAVVWLTLTFVPNGIIGFAIGTGMTFLFGLGKIGRNLNNVRDYIETNQRHFTTSVEQATQAILQ
jgi:hypothetical protein